MGYFYGGPEDGRVIRLRKEDLARGTVEVRDGHGTLSRYVIVELEQEQHVGDSLATHKLIPQEV